MLARPIGPDDNQKVDVSYRYGSTANGRYDIHHGVELNNPSGTPVLAAADGVVVVAGEDDFLGDTIGIELSTQPRNPQVEMAKTDDDVGLFRQRRADGKVIKKHLGCLELFGCVVR